MGAIYDEIVRANTRQLEFWCGLQGIGAGLMAVFDVSNSSVNGLFAVSVACFVLQVGMAMSPSLRWRHYTNMLGMVVGLVISVMIFSHDDGDLLGVGGYGFLAAECGFCAFWTRVNLERMKVISDG